MKLLASQVNRLYLGAKFGEAVDGRDDGIVLLLQLLKIGHAVFSFSLFSPRLACGRAVMFWFHVSKIS
jgi:hypothetical protein